MDKWVKMELNHISLFSGIGGDTLSAQWAGFETVMFVEIDKFCQQILNKHWPDVPVVGDIKGFDGRKYKDTITLISGGDPCQPNSIAGKRRGAEDDRYLWPEMLRVISEVRPTWIIGENVAGIVNMELEQVLSDLEGEGYETQSFIIPACAVNAPHRRDRVWIVAHASPTGTRGEGGKTTDEKRRTSENRGEGIRQGDREACTSGITPTNSHAPDTKSKNDRGYLRGKEERQIPEPGNSIEQGTIADTSSERLQRNICRQFGGISDKIETSQGSESCGIFSENKQWQEPWIEVATRLCRVDDGLSRGMDRVNRLKALGNAIVPQVVVPIMQAIKRIEAEASQFKLW